MGSVVSSENEGPPDDLCRNCGHGRRQHPALTQGRCTGEILTPAGDDRNNCPCKMFWPDHLPMAGPIDLRSDPADAEAAGKPECSGICLTPADIGVPEYGGPGVVAYAHPDCPAHGEPEAPHEHDWSEWGAVYHGGHLRWRKCFGCIEVQSTPEGHFCPDCAPVCESPKGCHAPSACQESCAFGDQLRGIRMVPRSDPEPEAPEEPACRNCGSTDGSWFDRALCEPPCDAMHNRCRNCGFPAEDCAHDAPQVPEPPRRPPYAVAYAIEGGAQYEIALPGDATVRAVDGALVITHDKPVLAMGQVRPMEGA